MKRIGPLILVAAVVFIAAGLVLRHRDPATAYTADKAAWDLYDQGEFYLQAFRYREAEQKLEQALALDGNLAMAHVALAELHYRLGRSEPSKRQYAMADSLAGLVTDDRARLLLEVRLSQSRSSRFFADADSLLAAAQAESPDELIVLVAQALAADRDRDLDLAERTWKHILEINPNYAGAYNFLGYLYLGRGRYDEAEAAIRKYAFVAPDLANPHDSLGEVLMTVGRYEEAEEEFKAALKKQPDFFYSLRNIGRIYIERGEVDRALALVDTLATVDAIKGTAIQKETELDLIHRLFIHRVQADFESYATRFLATYPTDDNVPSVRIRLLLAHGETDLALALLDSFRRVREQDPQFLESEALRARLRLSVSRWRGLAAEQAGDAAAAARYFQESLALARDFPPHESLFERIHLAYNLIPLRGYDEARIQVREALTVNPRIAEGTLVAASIEAAAGQTAEAHRLLDTVERILERADPDYPVLLDAKRLREELPDRDGI
ncbi:MAG TPA: tetratricopeptide repeat protein [Candidatus Krumholzibacteria bacterium]|nr:tetratricopeptide repeat protein [Candidatus Krumholzibacteria bacterium]HPD71006.1 tetratricopeptide repeat protein [Candidatus Krumholzibacteria bacterium]HRY39294.1 tetratricopeptide repeat protein [Candidatus Krumholzibacteria bacterium]